MNHIDNPLLVIKSKKTDSICDQFLPMFAAQPTNHINNPFMVKKSKKKTGNISSEMFKDTCLTSFFESCSLLAPPSVTPPFLEPATA